MCAAFLSSCGSSDSSQPSVQTTTAGDGSSVLTVTTAAEKAETDDVTAAEKTDSSGEAVQTGKPSVTTTRSSDKNPVTQAVSTTKGATESSATGSSATQTKPVSTADPSKTTTTSHRTSTTTAASSSKPQQPLPGNGIDSRQYLLDLMKDTKLRAAAKSVMADMQAGKTVIAINDGVLKESRLSDFIGLISMLEAESYIIPSPYSYTVNKSGYVTGIRVTKYPKTVKQYQNEKTAVNELAEKLAAQAEENCPTQFDKVLFFHDYIINNCVYDTDAANGASAYGCLIEGKAVCEGYAKAMQVLCSAAGIECVPVTGHAAYNGNSQSHMWNLINIDGCWTHVDATWDDIESGPISAASYSYFGLTDAQIHIDHSVSSNPLISIPKATADSSCYYVRRGYYISSEARIHEVLEKAVNDAVAVSADTVTVRCASEELYELTSNAAASGSYEYEYMIELIKKAKSKHGITSSGNDSFLIGDAPNAKDTYTIIFFLKYD